ncbi:phosphonate ABC transporter ATP-binding protein [soil metagenome]
MSDRRAVSAPARVELSGVSVYHGAVAALDGVDLVVGAGERVALVGPSGAGKTTLLSLVGAATSPTSGRVTVFGSSPSELGRVERRALRRRIGMMYQQLPLPGSLRVVHNVNAGRIGQWSTWRAITSLVRPREVADVQRALDVLGIGDKLWRRTDELSGGERQRVALARLVVQGAELVLADEPTANLDPARARDVLGSMAAVAADGDRTLLVSLHAFDLAVEFFDRVVGLRDGQVMFDLPAGEVTHAHADGLYRLGTVS